MCTACTCGYNKATLLDNHPPVFLLVVQQEVIYLYFVQDNQRISQSIRCMPVPVWKIQHEGWQVHHGGDNTVSRFTSQQSELSLMPSHQLAAKLLVSVFIAICLAE